MNLRDDLDDNGEDLLRTLTTTREGMLMTLMTTGEDLLMTHADDTDEHCDDNVLGSCYDLRSSSVNKQRDILCGVYDNCDKKKRTT